MHTVTIPVILFYFHIPPLMDAFAPAAEVLAWFLGFAAVIWAMNK